MTDSLFAIAPDDRYFEDYPQGSVHEFGTVEVTTDEIIAFACRYDPQEFHTDPETAKDTIYGGLIASGWMTASLMMRLIVDHYLPRAASLGSPGVDELRWPLPVRPGDRLTVRATVVEARVSQSKPDRGILRTAIEVLNQRREVVMTMLAINFIRRREIPTA